MGERFAMDASCLFQPSNMVEEVTMVVSCLFHAVYFVLGAVTII